MNYKKYLGKIETNMEKLLSCKYYEGKTFHGYEKIIDNNDIEIYRSNTLKEEIIAAFQSVVVTTKKKYRNKKIRLYPLYTKKHIYYDICLNEKNFPGLIPESNIALTFLLPYMREVDESCYYKKWRLVVVTDKCQVYHNFPSRKKEYEGDELYRDIVHFEESAIWDIPERKYPSENKNVDETEFYYPYLPKACYEYHPGVNVKSKYGNSGFDKFSYVEEKGIKKKVSRFYFPLRNLESNPFFYMGGFETNYKMNLIGTYRSNTTKGVRTVLFATSDGGRNWYAKYEFSDEGEYKFIQGNSEKWGHNFGNPIVIEKISNYNCENMYLQKRILNHDGDSKFKWSSKVEIESMHHDNTLRIKTKDKHNLETGNIVILQSKSENINELSPIFSDEKEKNNGANGKSFKVEVIDLYNILLYECVSNPYNNIACRHIHHINRVRDGWMIGTGEIYPNGWIMYMQMKEADSFSKCSAANDMPIYILNTSSNSVQRTVGMDMIDKQNPIIVFASDHDMLKRPDVVLSNGVSFSRNSTGVYIGKLSDIDQFTEYELLYEAEEPAFFFKKIGNKYLFCGQRGEIATGTMESHNWTKARIDSTFFHFRGSTYRFCVIDEYLIIIK